MAREKISIEEKIEAARKEAFPKEYKDITFPHIVVWCENNNQVAWLKEVNAKMVTDKKTNKLRRITFIELKREFAQKFMPDIAPKKKNPNMYDYINTL